MESTLNTGIAGFYPFFTTLNNVSNTHGNIAENISLAPAEMNTLNNSNDEPHSSNIDQVPLVESPSPNPELEDSVAVLHHLKIKPRQIATPPDDSLLSTMVSLPRRIMGTGLNAGIDTGYYLHATAVDLVEFFSGDEDLVLATKAENGFRFLDGQYPFQCTVLLMRTVLKVIGDISLDLKSSALLTRRLREVMDCLGNSFYGLLAYTSATQRPIEPAHLHELEGALSRTLRYMVLLTGDDAMLHLMQGTDPQTRFERYDNLITYATNALLERYSLPTSVILRRIADYKPVCNLRSDLIKLNQRSSSEVSLGFPVEVAEVEKTLAQLTLDAVVSTSVTTHQLITQLTIREFWLKKFGAVHVVDISNFIGAVCAELHFCAETEDDKDYIRILVPQFKSTAMKSLARDQNNRIDVLEVAKAVRHIPAKNHHFAIIVESMVACGIQNCKKIIPPPTTHRLIVWNDGQKAQLLSLLSSTRGWVSVTGPQAAGKTTRVLDVVHSMDVHVDSLWVDLTAAFSTTEITSRIASQLYLRDCFTQAEFESGFRNLLNTLREGSVVVFDNFSQVSSNPTKKTRDTGAPPVPGSISGQENDFDYSASFGPILNIMKEFHHKFCFVTIACNKVRLVGAESKARKFYMATANISTLTPSKAQLLADDLLPFDPDSLKVAGKYLAGAMARLARYCHLDTIRTVKLNVLKGFFSEQNPSLGIAMEDVHALIRQEVATDCSMELTPDESLCAAALLRGTSYFDEALGWALCKDLFEGDLVRWYIAWKGLVHRGWLYHNPDLGYLVPAHAVVTDSPALERLDTQSQWDRYIHFWADQVIRMNAEAVDCASAFLYFDKHRPHFKFMFMNLSASPRQHSLHLVSDVPGLAAKLAGNVGRFLNYRFSPEGGVQIALTIVEHVKRAADGK